MSAGVFLGAVGGLYAVLRVAHGLGDYWLQTQDQADRKGGQGWPARGACLGHVGGQLVATVVALGVLAAVVPGPTLFSAPRLLAALAVIGVTHYFADRRAPLRRLACWVRRGRGMGWIDGGGLALLDQEWHRVWLLAAAVILAGGVPAV